MVRAEVNGVQSRIVARELSPQYIVYFMNHRFRVIAPLDARLICDQDGFHAAIVDFPDRWPRPRKGPEKPGMIHIADLFRDSAVTIHENSFMHLVLKFLTLPAVSETILAQLGAHLPPRR